MTESPTPAIADPVEGPQTPPSLLLPWLALGAGLAALTTAQTGLATQPVAAATPPVLVAEVNDAVTDFDLGRAPAMTLTPGPSRTIPPSTAEQLFAEPGRPVRAFPTGFTHPLLTAESSATPAAEERTTESTDTGPTAAQWAELRWCESSGDYRAISASGTYRGAYQFDLATWQSVGGTGDPAEADPAEQDLRAQLLEARRGSQPWPYCGRYIS